MRNGRTETMLYACWSLPFSYPSRLSRRMSWLAVFWVMDFVDRVYNCEMWGRKDGRMEEWKMKKERDMNEDEIVEERGKYRWMN